MYRWQTPPHGGPVRSPAFLQEGLSGSSGGWCELVTQKGVATSGFKLKLQYHWAHSPFEEVGSWAIYCHLNYVKGVPGALWCSLKQRLDFTKHLCNAHGVQGPPPCLKGRQKGMCHCGACSRSRLSGTSALRDGNQGEAETAWKDLRFLGEVLRMVLTSTGFTHEPKIFFLSLSGWLFVACHPRLRFKERKSIIHKVGSQLGMYLCDIILHFPILKKREI